MIPDKGFLSSLDFPDPRNAMAEGLVAVGGRLDVGTLYHAYRKGIFPWPQDDLPMLWFSPEERGVLFFDEVHVPRRLKRSMRGDVNLRFSMDEAFGEVIKNCRRQKRVDQAGTWILPEMVEAYQHFFEAGFAHSFEAWRGDRLVGGLYGVFVEGVFSGESMFHSEDDASKKVLLFAIEKLKKKNLNWIDTQMVTPVVASFGGRLVPRNDYLVMMKQAQADWNQRTLPKP